MEDFLLDKFHGGGWLLIDCLYMDLLQGGFVSVFIVIVDTSLNSSRSLNACGKQRQ